MINLNTPNQLPSKIRWYWLTKILLLLSPSLLFFPVFLILVIFLGLPLFLYLLLFYNSFTFIAEENKITINSGVVVKRSKSIPFSIIQNVENVRGLLHRVFGLSRVDIWTSSPEQIKAYKGSTTHKPDGSLDLIVEDGEWLKNFILNKSSK
jgi:membrane protein YdbS with pleckstrin-like domain